LVNSGYLDQNEKLTNAAIKNYLLSRNFALPLRPNRALLLESIHPFVIEYCSGLREAVIQSREQVSQESIQTRIQM